MVFDRDQAQEWSLRLALGTMGIVLILGLLNQISLTQILWRCGVSFGVVYGLTLGSFFLFEKSSAELHDVHNGTQGYPVGRLFDQAAGVEDPELEESFAAGQINEALTDSNVNMEQRAEILRKMGWTAEER